MAVAGKEEISDEALEVVGTGTMIFEAGMDEGRHHLNVEGIMRDAATIETVTDTTEINAVLEALLVIVDDLGAAPEALLGMGIESVNGALPEADTMIAMTDMVEADQSGIRWKTETVGIARDSSNVVVFCVHHYYLKHCN